MKAIERFFFTPVAPARPYLLARGILLLLAFDCWLDLAPHGGRYGVGDFNVSHFPWLDAIQPVPSPTIYMTCVLGAGMLAFVMAVSKPSRIGMGALFVAYTYGWLMSMLDSYQHHYLLSLLLFALIVCPHQTGTEVFGAVDLARGGARLRAAGATLLLFGCARVFFHWLDEDGSLFGLENLGWVVSVGLTLLGVFALALGRLTAPAVPAPHTQRPNTQRPNTEHPSTDGRAVASDADTRGHGKKKGKKKSNKKRAGKKKTGPTKPESAATVSGSAHATKTVPTAKHDAADAGEPASPTSGRSTAGASYREAWGHVLFGVSCAIVYFYTAVTKLSPRWRSGEPLRSLGRSEFYRDLEMNWVNDGGSADELWGLLALGAIAVQIVTCIGFLMATQQDRVKRPWLRALIAATVLAPLSFHFGAEHLSLEIGWFSYYMIWVAAVFFLPARFIEAAGRGLTLPSRSLVAAWKRMRASEHDDERFATMVLAVAAAVCVGALGKLVDLPGAFVTTVLAGLAVTVVAARSVRKGDIDTARLYTAATALGAFLMWASIAQSEVRFDYYRKLGGGHRRRGEWMGAFEAYSKANRYAPEGKDRQEREDEARRRVERLYGRGGSEE